MSSESIKVGDYVECNCGYPTCRFKGFVVELAPGNVRILDSSNFNLGWQPSGLFTTIPSVYGAGVSQMPGLPVLECPHEWKEYVGVMNRFEYCVKCDQKRGTV